MNNPELGVFGIAFSMGKGLELWSCLRERAGRQPGARVRLTLST